MGVRRKTYYKKSKVKNVKKNRFSRPKAGQGAHVDVQIDLVGEQGAAEVASMPTSPSRYLHVESDTSHTMPVAAFSTPTTYVNRGDVFTFPDSEVLSPIVTPVIRTRPTRCDNQGCDVSEGDEVSRSTLHGRRIVDIGFLFKQIQVRHPGGFDCSVVDLEFVKEHRAGFMCSWDFKCKVCNVTITVRSDPGSGGNLNDLAVIGMVAGGSGYATLSEFCGAMNLPCMTDNTYRLHEAKFAENVQQSTMESVLEAGRREREMALEKGEVATVSGKQYALTGVIADGMWGKRSYKTNYSSLSGTASIVGVRTKKVLFVGVRNRHCSYCTFYQLQGNSVPEHKCFKNWVGAPNGMEADIVAEGFKLSMEMHGLVYHQLIADGDSSVHSRLLETQPYGPNMMVEKIECKNHLLRNYRVHLKSVEFPKKRKNTLRPLIERLATDISTACVHWKREDGPLHDRVQSLRHDIMNAPSHVFGSHERCATYFCKGQKEGEENSVPDLIAMGVWVQIQGHTQRLADTARSLIHSVNNNPCEILNSVTAKFLNGKRINYSQRGSNFESRVDSAVLNFNTSGQFQGTVFRSMVEGESPGQFTKKFEAQKVSKLRANRRRRLQFPETRYTKKSKLHGPNSDYGRVDVNEDDPLPPEDPAELARKVADYLGQVQLTNDKRHALQAATTRQSQSHLWITERRKRLTAVFHGTVCKRRPDTSCRKLVRQIIHGGFGKKTSAMQHGLDTEDEAKAKLESLLGFAVQPCGMFVDREHPYLSSSPDGLVGTDAVVEIKCPVPLKELEEIDQLTKRLRKTQVPYPSALEALRDGKLKDYLTEAPGTPYGVKLRRDHNYHYQIQSQLRMADRSKCYFFVYTAHWHVLEIVERDKLFWTKMLPKLEEFYRECLLPELASPRFPLRRRLEDIREGAAIAAMQRLKKGECSRPRAKKQAKTAKTATHSGEEDDPEPLPLPGASCDQPVPDKAVDHGPAATVFRDPKVGDWAVIEEDGAERVGHVDSFIENELLVCIAEHVRRNTYTWPSRRLVMQVDYDKIKKLLSPPNMFREKRKVYFSFTETF